MSGIFGTRASLISDLNLLLQLIVLVILIVGVKFGKEKTEKSLKTHGKVMTVMVVLNATGILLVMLPSFVTNLSAVLNEPSTIGFPLTSIHVFFGISSNSLGIVLIFKKFGNVRMWMRLTAALWLIAIISGISFYLKYYVI
ncbi:MAG: hypothetical protein ACE5HG_01975 [Candidatus Bathyarchaeia archaeon]